MNKRYALLFLIFNVLNCPESDMNETLTHLDLAENLRLPKDPVLKKFWKEKNIENTIDGLGKDYKNIQILIQRMVLEYYGNPCKVRVLHSEITGEEIPNLLSIQKLVSQCMTHIYKLNGD